MPPTDTAQLLPGSVSTQQRDLAVLIAYVLMDIESYYALYWRLLAQVIEALAADNREQTRTSREATKPLDEAADDMLMQDDGVDAAQNERRALLNDIQQHLKVLSQRQNRMLLAFLKLLDNLLKNYTNEVKVGFDEEVVDIALARKAMFERVHPHLADALFDICVAEGGDTSSEHQLALRPTPSEIRRQLQLPEPSPAFYRRDFHRQRLEEALQPKLSERSPQQHLQRQPLSAPFCADELSLCLDHLEPAFDLYLEMAVLAQRGDLWRHYEQHLQNDLMPTPYQPPTPTRLPVPTPTRSLIQV